MNILLEQMHLHIGALRHLTELAKVHAPGLSAIELVEAEKLIDQAGWLNDEIVETLSAAISKSTIQEHSTTTP